MSFTGQLGTIDSVLGLSMELGGDPSGGGGGGSGGALLASSTLTLSQAVNLNSRPVRVNSDLSLSIAASIELPTKLAASTLLALSSEANYTGPKHVIGVSVINLAENAYQPQTRALAATSAIVLAQSPEHFGTQRLVAASPIAFLSLADTAIKIREAASTIAVAQSATADRVRIAQSALVLSSQAVRGVLNLTAATPLTLNQGLSQGPIPFGPTGQIVLSPQALTVGQTATTNIRVLQATSAIAATSTTKIQVPQHLSAGSVLQTTTSTTSIANNQVVTVVTINGLNDAASESATYTRAVGQNIPLVQAAAAQRLLATGVAVEGSTSLILSQASIKNVGGDAASRLTISQAAIADVCLPVSSSLSFDESATFTNNHVPASVLSAIEISHGAAFFIELSNTRFLYSPFVGGNSDPDAPTPPPATLDYPLSGQPAFQVVYPSSGLVTDALQIRAPNLGNKDTLAFTRINRETRGGKLIVYADPMWPKSQTMSLQFSALHKSEAYALLAFLQNHLGQQVGIVDWEWYYWVGVVTNPNDPIVQDSVDSFTASFEFEGVRGTWTEQTIPLTNLGCSSPSRVATINRSAMITCDCAVNTNTQGTTAAAVQAEADSSLTIGVPVYVTQLGHIAPSQANDPLASQVAGLSLGSYGAGISALYLTEGEVTSNDWTAVTGSATLQPGRLYFLDPNNPGRLAVVPPTSVGQYVVPVGRALSTTTLDIELNASILL